MGATVLASGIGPLGQLQIGALSDILGAPWAVRLSTFLGIAALVIITLTLPELHRTKDGGIDHNIRTFSSKPSPQALTGGENKEVGA